MNLKYKGLALAITIMFLLVGCGGGSSSSSSDSGSGEDTSDGTASGEDDSSDSTSTASSIDLFFNSGSISKIDPDNPSTTPVVVDSGITDDEIGIIDQTFDATNQAVTNKTVRTIIYSKDDGKLYKVSGGHGPEN